MPFRANARVPHVRTVTHFKKKIDRPPRASFAELHRNYDDTAGRLARIWNDIFLACMALITQLG